MTTYPDGPWRVAQGTWDDGPVFVRINTGAAAVREEPTLRHRIGVAVPLRAPNAHGLPEADEAGALHRIEDALVAALGCGTVAVLVLVLTTGGMREFVLHTTKPAAVRSAVAAVQARFPMYTLQHIVHDDPGWDVYREFAE